MGMNASREPGGKKLATSLTSPLTATASVLLAWLSHDATRESEVEVTIDRV